MKYSLQVVRGRSEAATLKLVEGVNSVGRQDDCLIRIRSAQVSRRHCEVVIDGDSLLVRDLGSSNGTYVNDKRVLGQQALKPGDVLTIGGVTFRIDLLEDANGAEAPAKSMSDTAEVAALAVLVDDEDANASDNSETREDDEFMLALDGGTGPESATSEDDVIPLEEEKSAPAPVEKTPAAKVKKKSSKKSGSKKKEIEDADEAEPEDNPKAKKSKAGADEDAAVAEFLDIMGLKED